MTEPKYRAFVSYSHDERLASAIVFFGSSFIERVISAWSVIFYIVYGSMFFMVVHRFAGGLTAALATTPLSYTQALRDCASYTGYNIAVLPVLMFVARNFRTRSEALVSGALAGPLILLPGFAFLLALWLSIPPSWTRRCR